MLVGMCRVRMSGLVVALVPAFNEERYVASVLVRLREYVDLYQDGFNLFLVLWKNDYG